VPKRIRKLRPYFDYSAGHIVWELEPPPHGLNHQNQQARDGTIYTRPESRLWQKYATLQTGGWLPPYHKPLAVTVDFYLAKNKLLAIDAGKWAEVVIDGVVGARCDQWVFRSVATKRVTDGPPKVRVEVMWEA
jgi:hypothetical protein